MIEKEIIKNNVISDEEFESRIKKYMKKNCNDCKLIWIKGREFMFEDEEFSYHCICLGIGYDIEILDCEIVSKKENVDVK